MPERKDNPVPVQIEVDAKLVRTMAKPRSDRYGYRSANWLAGGLNGEYGEWNRKGASLSDVTAKKEYKVDRDFIIKGINAGKLEYRDGSVWGNPYIKVLRRQLEEYITSELGPEYLAKARGKIELRKFKKEIAEIEQQLSELQIRKAGLETKKAELEKIMKK